MRRTVYYLFLVTWAMITTYLVYDMLTRYSFKPKWPQYGQMHAIREMARLMIRHDCDPERESWGRSESGETYHKYRRAIEYCQHNYTHEGWTISEQSVTAFFRCDLNERFAEYAVTVYQKEETVLDEPWCQYVIKSVSDDMGLGKNLKKLGKLPQ